MNIKIPAKLEGKGRVYYFWKDVKKLKKKSQRLLVYRAVILHNSQKLKILRKGESS